MPSDESKGSQLDAIGSLAQRQLDNTVSEPERPRTVTRRWRPLGARRTPGRRPLLPRLRGSSGTDRRLRGTLTRPSTAVRRTGDGLTANPCPPPHFNARMPSQPLARCRIPTNVS